MNSNGYFTEAICIFPHPVANQTTLTVFSKTATAGRLQVLNSQGTILKELPVNINSGTNVLTMPVSGLSAGSYFIRIIRKESKLPLQTRFIKM